MGFTIAGSSGQGSGAPVSNSISTGSNTAASSVGKLQFDATNVSTSLLNVPTGIAAIGQGLGKGIVNFTENIPVAGLITKPVIGAVGAVADATVGQVVGALSRSPIGQAFNTVVTTAAEVAFSPVDLLLKGLTFPSRVISSNAAKARIEATIQGYSVPFLGPVPQSVVSRVNSGESIDDVAWGMAGEFGSPDASLGAWSQNGLANLLLTFVTDPFTWFGGELLKPISIAKQAARLEVIGGEKLLALSRETLVLSEKAVAAGDKELGAKFLAESAKHAKDAQLLEKWGWSAEIYKQTFGRIKNPLSLLVGSKYANELSTAVWRAVDAGNLEGLSSRIELAAGKDAFKASLADMAISLEAAGRAGVQDVATQAGINVQSQLGDAIIGIAYRLAGEGADAAAIAAAKVGDTSISLAEMLGKLGANPETINKIIARTIEHYDANPKIFAQNPRISETVNMITDILKQRSIKDNVEVFRAKAAMLGQANLRLFADSAIKVISENKLILQRFAETPADGIRFLASALEHIYPQISAEKALEIATAEFASKAGDTRALINVLEYARAASFGKSVRILAELKGSIPKTFGAIPTTVARRQQLANAFFGNLIPEEASAVSSVFDAVAYASATRRNLTISEFYDKYVYGISGVTDGERAISVVDSLYNMHNQIRASFELARTPQEYLGVANSLIPDQRILDVESTIPGFSRSLDAELIPTLDGSNFALPGGEAFLANDEAYSLLEQIKISAQPWNEAGLSEEVRTQIYKKIWASKNIDMQDHVQVINRIMHAVISPQLPLSSNAGIYSLLRVRNAEELSAFAAKFGELARNPNTPDSVLGAAVKESIGGGEKLPVMGANVGYAARQMVFAADNPAWFKLQAGEGMAQFAERLSLLKGSAMKVATFSPEMMRVSDMPFGAIDSQMTVGIFHWAIRGGRLEEVLASLRAIGKNGEEYILKNESTIKKLQEKVAIGDTNLRDVAGIEATGIEVSLAPTKRASWAISDQMKSLYDQVPEYLRKGKITTFKGSSFEVMNQWLDEWAKSVPGLAGRSTAEKQWYFWDKTRLQMEPHFWLSAGVDGMARPAVKDVLAAIKAVGTSGGSEKVAYRGTNPNIIQKLTESRGGQILGVTNIAEDGRAMIKLFEGSDITTALHEVGHFARRQLDAADQAIVEGVYKNSGVWDVASEERFAKEFVSYLHTGRAPLAELDTIFSKIRAWVTSIWSDTSASAAVNIDPQVREVFDRLFIANTESLAQPADHIYSRLSLSTTRSMTQEVRSTFVKALSAARGLTDGSTTMRPLSEAIAASEDYFATKNDLLKTGGATYNPLRGTVRSPGDALGGGISVAFDRKMSLRAADGTEGLTGTLREGFLNDPAYRNQVLAEFINKNQEILRNDNFYVGIYDNGKKVFVDVSKVFMDMEQAIAHGLANGEESIYSFAGAEGKTLYLNTEKGIAQAAIAKEPIVSSLSDVKDLASFQLEQTPAAIEAKLRPIANEAVMKYDEVARYFYNSKASAEEILTFIKNHPEVSVRELSAVEKQYLPEQLKNAAGRLEAAGYRFTMAPENGVLERTAMVEDAFGQKRITTVSSPFVELLDQAALKTFDKNIGQYARKPNLLERFVARMTRQYGSDVTRNNYIERFTVSLMKDANVSQMGALRIISEVGNLAARKETKVAGLWIEREEVGKIFKGVMGESGYQRYVTSVLEGGAGKDPFTEIIRAAAGDLNVVGIAPGLTGRVKVWKPVMTIITDRAYPVARFGRANPIFWNILEPIETKVMKLVHGIKTEIAGDFSAAERGSWLQKLTSDNASISREISDGLVYDQGQNAVATLTVALENPGFFDRVAQVLRIEGVIKDAKVAILDPLKTKKIARDITAAEFGARTVYERLFQVAPETMKDLAEFGLTDATSLISKLIEDGLTQSNPEALARALEAGRNPTTALWEDSLRGSTNLTDRQIKEVVGAAYGIMQESMITATRKADRYQYFSQYRSWFERSINHPYFGLYPYSYMTQKAIPAMLTALFTPRIGGQVRPAFGIINYMRLKEFIASESAGNDGFIKDLVKNRSLWYAVNILLPATPENMGFSLPNYLRNGFIQPAMQNQPLDLNALSKIPTYAGETVMRGTVLGQGASILEAAGSLGDNLETQMLNLQEPVNRFFNP